MKIYGKHKPITEEMIADLSLMGDQEFMVKWDTSRQYPIRARKRLGIKPFNKQHGTYSHEFRDGKEYKWCGSGHWELVENFGVHSSRYDGLRGHCKEHSNESSRRAKQKEYSTPEGKSRIRKNNNRRKNGYVLWERKDELRAFELYKNRCAYCGCRITFKSVEFDHIIPISKGGKTIPENMVPSCVRCNRGVNGKKARDLKEWLYSRYGTSYFADCVLENIEKNQGIIKRESEYRVRLVLQDIELEKLK